MLALCSMLSETYYAQNYAGILGLGLPRRPGLGHWLLSLDLLSYSDYLILQDVSCNTFSVYLIATQLQ